MEYKTILKKIFFLILIVTIFIFSAKLFMFYIPFLIAYIISLIVDPIIRFINKNTNISRKTSSIIVLATVFLLALGFISWGVISLVSESTHLLGALNTYLEKAIAWSNSVLENFNMDKLSVPVEIKELIQSTSTDILNKVIDFIKNILNNFLEYLKSIPTILIYTVITILATYFITSDKFYILDRLEHHIPKKVLGKNYRALPFIERYKEERVREIIMPSKAELDEEFLKKLMEILKRERKFVDLFHEINLNSNKIEQKNREEDDYEI